jgi:hypothetical protein
MALPYFSTLSCKKYDFGRDVIGHKMCGVSDTVHLFSMDERKTNLMHQVGFSFIHKMCVLIFSENLPENFSF